MTARLSAAVLLATVLLMLTAAPALAHPLGNFTTNTSAAILPGPEAISLVYVLDLAEIPAQRAQRDIDDAGGESAWAADTCEDILTAQELRVAGQPEALTLDAVGVTFPEGEAGLSTLRLRCDASAPVDSTSPEVAVGLTDGYQPDRIGWREIMAAGDGVRLVSADVPSTSATDQLRSYPTGEVSSVTAASLAYDQTVRDSGDAEAVAMLTRGQADLVTPEAPGGLEGLVQRYTDLVSRQDLTVGFVLLAIVLAIGLGTAHAVAPGHGKTVIAAYLLGEGGQARQAVGLGTTVAITHTIGVLVLGVLVQTSTVLAPERLYPILGVMGGALFMLVGVTLLRRALKGGEHGHGPGQHTHDHDHDHPHPHPHDAGDSFPSAGHDHDHDHPHDHDHAPAGSGWRMLVLPGLAGGMVPSPSALLVLLGGIAIGRTWFGVLLVIAYGVGMALALVGAGYLLHRVRFRVIDRLESPTWARISNSLPVATSSLIIVGGLVIVARSLLTA